MVSDESAAVAHLPKSDNPRRKRGSKKDKGDTKFPKRSVAILEELVSPHQTR